jgi:hypothetical protein
VTKESEEENPVESVKKGSTGAAGGGETIDVDENQTTRTANQKSSSAAWVDDDDLEVNLVGTSNRLRKLRKHRCETNVSATTYESRLRERYETTTQITAHTEWAAVVEHTETNEKNHRDDDDDEHAILTSADTLLASRGAVPPNILTVERCSDLNMDDPNKAVVQAVDFHKGSDPDRPMALTAGLDKTLRFFQVTAEKSEKVHGFHCTSD